MVDKDELERPVPGVAGREMPEPQAVLNGEEVRDSELPDEFTVADIEASHAEPPVEVDRGRSPAVAEDHVKDTIARAVISGLPMPEIAAMVRHTPTYVRKLMATDDMKVRIKLCAGRVEATIVNHRFEMMERMDRAHSVISNALDSADEKLATATAWKIVEQVVPKPADRLEITADARETLGPIEQAHVNETLVAVREQMEKMSEAITSGDMDFKKSLILDGDMPSNADVVGHEK